jgi:protein translocase SecG subunit
LITYLFYGLFILSCVVLIVVVLLQPGKADAGALFSSSVSSTAFGPRGTASLLSKITIGAAAAFMLIALLLSSAAITGQRSVLQRRSRLRPRLKRLRLRHQLRRPHRPRPRRVSKRER